MSYDADQISFHPPSSKPRVSTYPKLHLTVLSTAHEPTPTRTSENDSIDRSIVLVLQLLCEPVEKTIRIDSR